MKVHRIFLVDDDPDVRSVLGAALREKYEVVEAADGLQALDKLEDYQPDLAILEAVLPVMDGFELCTAIREDPRFGGIPILFLSSYGSRQNIQKGYAAGANLFITKPIDPMRVVKNIDFTIESNQIEVRRKRFSIPELKRRDEETRERELNPPPAPEPPLPSSPRRHTPPAEEFCPPEVSEEIIGTLSETEEVEEVEVEASEEKRWEKPEEISEPEPEPEPELEVAEPESVSAPIPPRVMIVENEADTRELIEATLRRRCEVTTAVDGLEAMEKIVEYQPDIVIVEVMSPRMSGHQVLQSLRHNSTFRDMPIVMVSSKASKRDRAYAMRLGATDFVAKPISADDLLQCIESIIASPDFHVAPKRTPIHEIIEREFLNLKERTDMASQRLRKAKYAEIHEILRNERRETKP
ncbi:response regulator [Candidatus Sumerlaeota bacterium]|nr:response regulator [Candidatus Sumerlaeota bacterium]